MPGGAVLRKLMLATMPKDHQSMQSPWCIISTRASLIAEGKRAKLESVIRIDAVDRAVGHFVPLFMADWLRRDHYRPIGMPGFVVDMREAAYLAIMHPAPLDEMQRSAETTTDHLASIGNQQIKAQSRARIYLVTPSGDHSDHGVKDIQRWSGGLAILHRAQQLQHMLAIGVAGDRRAAMFWKLRQQKRTDPIEIRDRAIMNERPAAIKKRMRVSQRWLTNRRPANMGKHLFRVYPSCRPAKMFAMIGRPRLPLHMRDTSVKRYHAPAIRVRFACLVRLALYHQGILRMHQRAFDLGRLTRAKSIQAAHESKFTPADRAPYPQCSGGVQ